MARHDDGEDTRVAEARHITVVLARYDVIYEDAKTRLAALCCDSGTNLETSATDHPLFIDGRAAAVVIDGEEAGIVEEPHPKVIVEHNLELSATAFEFDLSALM